MIVKIDDNINIDPTCRMQYSKVFAIN